MNILNSKIAVITGGAKGIGAATARLFAKQGAEGVVIADIDVENSSKTVAEISQQTSCKCIALKTNVASEVDVENVFDSIIKEFGTIDILVNSAGICRLARLDDITMEQWDRTMDVNLKGTFLFSRAALKIMQPKRYGKIINVASQAGKIGGLIVGPDYPVSKAGVICLTKSLAKAVASFNININSVAPGLISTQMTQNFGYDPSLVPLGRIGTPEEVAQVILFLASDMSNYITGACIDVNGGMTMW